MGKALCEFGLQIKPVAKAEFRREIQGFQVKIEAIWRRRKDF